MKKILIIKNILSPYRVHFFNLLDEQLVDKGIEFKVVLTASSEGNRNWHYEDYKLRYSLLLKNFSIQIFNRYLHFGFGLNKLINDFKPDLVILAGYYYLPNHLTLLSKRKNIQYKTIFWSESNNLSLDSTHPILSRIRQVLRNYVYQRVDGFMSPGMYSDEFINKLSKGQPIIRIPNLINNENFLQMSLSNFNAEEFKSFHKINSFRFILFTSSRLEHIKGIIEMIKKISNSIYRDEIVYVIAGEGSLKAQILNLAEDLKVNVRLVGYLDEVNLVRFHSISYCFVLSSLSDASPLSVIEALWMTKPLLLSKFVGNAPETLVENKNGFLIDVSNDNPAQIDRLLSLDNNEYQKFCRESFRIARTNFDSNLVTSRFIENLMKFDKGVINEYN